MTDPERISKRSLGLAAQLLQAGAEERPPQASLQQTLTALGVSAAAVTAASTASAVVGGAKATSALGVGTAGLGAGASTLGLGASATGATVKAVSTTLLIKWIGIGVVSGVGLAGAAAVATAPAKPSVSHAAHTTVAAPAATRALVPAPAKRGAPEPPPSSTAAVAPVVEGIPAVAAPAQHVGPGDAVATSAALEVGAPLAAEVAYVDRARALLVAGQSEPGLTLLRGYEREFPEARLLPEVLFLQLESCDRLGRASEARAAAQRLLDGFPKSPHASRARKLLFP